MSIFGIFRRDGKSKIASGLEAEIWFRKGYALYKQRKYRKAISCYDKALEINSSDADCWVQRGVALDSLNKNENALSSFDKALEIDSKCTFAWVCKGATLFKSLNNCSEALKCVDEAIKIDPESKEAHELKQLIQEAVKILSQYRENKRTA